jgi:hypothetical protein
MIHHTCPYFDSFILHLQEEWRGFTLNELAEQIKCTTERIRRIRIGEGMMDVNDISTLMEYYQANPVFLLTGKKPYRITGDMQIVSEPGIAYGRTAAEENKYLKKMLADKEKLIEMYEEKLKQPKPRKKN